MAITQLSNTVVSPGVATRPQQRVSVKKTWAADWDPIAYLECMECTDAAAPSVRRASFRWRYGNIKWADLSDYETFNPKNLKDNFVKVEILPVGGAPYPLWGGIITDDLLDDQGNAFGSALGDQHITAYGLEHILDRQYVYGAVVTNDGTTPTYLAHCPLAFNQDYVQGFVALGNRSENKVAITSSAGASQSCYLFADSGDGTDPGTPWTARDVLEYLLYNFGPSQLPFIPSGQLDALDAIVLPRLEIRGQSLLQILNQLIDRRYGVGFRVHQDDEQAFVEVFTLVDSPVKLDSAQIPANKNVGSIDLETLGHLPQQVQFTADTLSTFSRIIVQGEPIVSMFSVSYQDGTLVPFWSDDEEATYKNPAAGVDDSDDPFTAEDFDRMRAADGLARVFTTFQIPAKWGWITGAYVSQADADPGVPYAAANPQPDSLGRVDGTKQSIFDVPQAPVRDFGHRLLRSLPLLNEAGRLLSKPEYRVPFVLVQDPTTKKYRPIERGAAINDVVGSVRMLDQDFGIEVRCHPQHLLALNDWNDATVSPSSTEPALDYKFMIATVAARTDVRLAVQIDLPQNAGKQADGSLGPGYDRTLYINIPDAEMWYVTPGTVLDLDPNSDALIRASSPDKVEQYSPIQQGFVVRDDGPRLRAIGAYAQAWYGKTRSTMTLRVADIWTGVGRSVGTFIQTVSDAARYQPVNSCITEVTWDLQTMQTTLKTQFSELDFSGDAPRIPTIS